MLILVTIFQYIFLAEVLVEAKKALNIPEDVETRLWHKYMQNTYEIIIKMDTTLQDHTITSGQVEMVYSFSIYCLFFFRFF